VLHLRTRTALERPGQAVLLPRPAPGGRTARPARANQFAWEAKTLVAAGLEPYDALAAATINGGRLLGEPSAGLLAQGGPADFLLVHDDPLSDPGSLWLVWRTSW
jgi:imidazolonepropionase-like amidohydrolase